MNPTSTRPAAPTDPADTSGPAVPRRVPLGLAPGVPQEAAGQDAAKYGSSNPVVQRLLHRWTTRLREVLGTIGGTVVDVGVGEGLCLERLLGLGAPGASAPASAGHDDGRADGHGGRPGRQPVDGSLGPPDLRVVGVEYRFDKARAACRLPVLAPVVGDAGMLPLPDAGADLVLCIEVLEHLPAVEPAVAELARVARDRCVVSVPWEPWFRLGNLGRGKNVRRLGNDPEHVRAFTPGRLRRALAQGFGDVRIVPAFPWLIAEAHSPVR